MNGDYFTDNARPCSYCGSTCCRYSIGQDYRCRAVVHATCIACTRTVNLGLLPLLQSDDAKGLSAWHRQGAK